MTEWTILTLVYTFFELVVHKWYQLEFHTGDPDPFQSKNGGQTRHARGPVWSIRDMYGIKRSVFMQYLTELVVLSWTNTKYIYMLPYASFG